MSDIWKSDVYVSTDIEFLISADIREYDASAAGFNILIRAGALKPNEITYLNNLPKVERNIRLGCMIRDNRELAAIQKEGFKLMRRDFIDLNKIDDSDIISIKKDAFFLVGKVCHELDIDNIHFRLANQYSSYMRLGRIELYFLRSLYEGNKLDVKGIANETLKLHESGILQFINKVFILAETTTNERVVKYIYKTAMDYKNYRLPIEWYREFNNESQYLLKYLMAGSKILINNVDTLEGVDISYNYRHVIMKMLSYF